MKNKATILPGLMLFASFVILMVCGMGFDFVFSRFPSLGIVLIELLAFVPPTYCLYKSQDQNFRLNFRWEKQPDKLPVYFGFTVKFALAVSFLSSGKQTHQFFIFHGQMPPKAFENMD